MVKMVAEEVTLDVCNSEGWSVIFDKKPTKVLTFMLKVTGYSLRAILIHYFAKSECWMEPSTMVLCKMDKYYNQMKF